METSNTNPDVLAIADARRNELKFKNISCGPFYCSEDGAMRRRDGRYWVARGVDKECSLEKHCIDYTVARPCTMGPGVEIVFGGKKNLQGDEAWYEVQLNPADAEKLAYQILEVSYLTNPFGVDENGWLRHNSHTYAKGVAYSKALTNQLLARLKRSHKTTEEDAYHAEALTDWVSRAISVPEIAFCSTKRVADALQHFESTNRFNRKTEAGEQEVAK